MHERKMLHGIKLTVMYIVIQNVYWSVSGDNSSIWFLRKYRNVRKT